MDATIPMPERSALRGVLFTAAGLACVAELTTAWSIPGVRISTDRNGDEARRFGVRTSGHVVIYGADGRLLFSGGITGARGHVGDNVGLDRAMVATRGGCPESCPVFGCGLESHR